MTNETRDDFEDICTFCSEVAGDDRLNLFLDEGITPEEYILLETDHWVVFPCIGALTDWYVLIVSKRHVLSVGWLDEAAQNELRHHVIPTFQEELRRRSGCEVILFEHGSLDFRNNGGACFDHAHVHAVATERSLEDFLPFVPDSVQLAECQDWISRATDMVRRQNLSYLALASQARHLVGVATGAPSQFFRRALANWLGGQEVWDWYVNRQMERVRRMTQGRW